MTAYEHMTAYELLSANIATCKCHTICRYARWYNIYTVHLWLYTTLLCLHSSFPRLADYNNNHRCTVEVICNHRYECTLMCEKPPLLSVLKPNPLTLSNHMVDLTKISLRHVKCLDVASTGWEMQVQSFPKFHTLPGLSTNVHTSFVWVHLWRGYYNQWLLKVVSHVYMIFQCSVVLKPTSVCWSAVVYHCSYTTVWTLAAGYVFCGTPIMELFLCALSASDTINPTMHVVWIYI